MMEMAVYSMRDVVLIHPPRSQRRHVKASPIQNHDWYLDLYAGTLCGSWIQVAWAEDPIPIDELDAYPHPICTVCTRKTTRFT